MKEESNGEMRRIWFKQDMKDAILAGRKTVTIRIRPLELGKYRAVSGSRYAATPFAVIEIEDRIPTTWDCVVHWFYQDEGFESSWEMESYAKVHSLIKSMFDSVFFHRFKVVNLNECP